MGRTQEMVNKNKRGFLKSMESSGAENNGKMGTQAVEGVGLAKKKPAVTPKEIYKEGTLIPFMKYSDYFSLQECDFIANDINII